MGYPDFMKETSRKKYKHTEARLQLAIIRYCKIKGFVIGKTKTFGLFKNGKYWKDKNLFTGYPDLTVFCPGLVFIEVKSPVGTMSRDQASFKELCKKAGVQHIIARRLEDVSQVI